MKFAATFIAVATAGGVGSANDASAVDCGSDNRVTTCWEAYASFIPSANQTEGAGDFTGPYGTEWDAQKTSDSCGLKFEDNVSMQNKTCDIAFSAGAQVNVGGAAFVLPNGQIAGLDFSSEVTATFTWEQDMGDVATWVNDKKAGGDTNVTSTDIGNCFTTGANKFGSITNCQPSNTDGTAVDTPMIMFTNNQPGESNTFAIANAKSSVSVSMNVACNNVSSDMGQVTFSDTATCSFVIDIEDWRSALLQFTADTQSQVDFFAVSVQ